MAKTARRFLIVVSRGSVMALLSACHHTYVEAPRYSAKALPSNASGPTRAKPFWHSAAKGKGSRDDATPPNRVNRGGLGPTNLLAANKASRTPSSRPERPGLDPHGLAIRSA